MEGIETPPVVARRPWRLRHPAVARGILYGAAVALGTAGYAYAAHCREEARQSGLVTVIHGVETAVRAADPETALRVLRQDVLAKNPNDDVRRRALLSEAAALDTLHRFEESEACYRRIRAEWPQGRPLGALVLPWANMRVRAGKPADALDLLDDEGATAGEAADDVRSVREAALRPVPIALRPR